MNSNYVRKFLSPEVLNVMYQKSHDKISTGRRFCLLEGGCSQLRNAEHRSSSSPGQRQSSSSFRLFCMLAAWSLVSQFCGGD
jgi:hypothetical protein